MEEIQEKFVDFALQYLPVENNAKRSVLRLLQWQREAKADSFVELFAPSPIYSGQMRLRPVTDEHKGDSNFCAVQLFAYRYEHAQTIMDAIFGKHDRPELWSPRNGLLLSKQAEVRLRLGLFVIVPDVPDHQPLEDVLQWEAAETKRYKICVLEPEDPLMQQTTSGLGGETWNDCNGKVVVFPTDQHPRACYFYFLYCTTMLIRTWRRFGDERMAGNILSNKLGKPCWATRGPFMKRSMVRAFVREFGDGSESLFMGAIADEDESTPIDQTALATAIVQAQCSLLLREFAWNA